MRAFRFTRLVWLLSASMLFLTTAKAMEIQKFDKMAAEDQGAYIATLIVGAQKVLIDAGRNDDADKVQNLFAKVLPGDKVSVGAGEFVRNLDRARVADVQNIIKDPKAQRLEVEDAMFVTLQKNHIELPDSFFTVAKNFKPKYPPQSK